jgi:hypothetical protein
MAFTFLLFGWRRRRLMPVLLPTVACFGLGPAVGCGGASTGNGVGSGSSPATYTVTITGAAGTIQEATPVSLTVE